MKVSGRIEKSSTVESIFRNFGPNKMIFKSYVHRTSTSRVFLAEPLLALRKSTTPFLVVFSQYFNTSHFTGCLSTSIPVSTVELAHDEYIPADGNRSHRPLLILHGF